MSGASRASNSAICSNALSPPPDEETGIDVGVGIDDADTHAALLPEDKQRLILAHTWPAAALGGEGTDGAQPGAGAGFGAADFYTDGLQPGPCKYTGPTFITTPFSFLLFFFMRRPDEKL